LAGSIWANVKGDPLSQIANNIDILVGGQIANLEQLRESLDSQISDDYAFGGWWTLMETYASIEAMPEFGQGNAVLKVIDMNGEQVSTTDNDDFRRNVWDRMKKLSHQGKLKSGKANYAFEEVSIKADNLL